MSNLFKAAKAVVDKWGFGDLASAVRELDRAVRDEDFNKATPAEILAAQEDYQDDDVEIDEGADVSRNDDGAWVSAWVFVSKERLEKA